MSSSPVGYYRVVADVPDAHPFHNGYPLLKGDILWHDENDWTKTAPGMTLSGFEFEPGVVRGYFEYLGIFPYGTEIDGPPRPIPNV
jgi:hypothetical protein